MMHIFTLLWQVWHNGRKYKITSGSMVGSTRLEFDFCAGFIRDPHARPLSPIMPKGIDPVCTDEHLDTDYFPNYLMNPELARDKKGRLLQHYKYAEWINSTKHYNEYKFFRFNSIEKIEFNNTKFKEVIEYNREKKHIVYSEVDETPIEWIIRHFQEKGYGNNHCHINVGNSDSNFAYDIPYVDETDRRTSPCLRSMDFKIKDNRLILSIVFRSWDLYAGFPENMGGFALLNQYVCNHLDGVEPGPLAFTSAGLHAYDYQIEPIMAILHKDEHESFKKE